MNAHKVVSLHARCVLSSAHSHNVIYQHNVQLVLVYVWQYILYISSLFVCTFTCVGDVIDDG